MNAGQLRHAPQATPRRPPTQAVAAVAPWHPPLETGETGSTPRNRCPPMRSDPSNRLVVCCAWWVKIGVSTWRRRWRRTGLGDVVAFRPHRSNRPATTRPPSPPCSNRSLPTIGRAAGARWSAQA